MVNIAKAKKIQGNPGSGIYFINSFWVAITFIIFSLEIFLCTSQVHVSVSTGSMDLVGAVLLLHFLHILINL